MVLFFLLGFKLRVGKVIDEFIGSFIFYVFVKGFKELILKIMRKRFLSGCFFRRRLLVVLLICILFFILDFKLFFILDFILIFILDFML